MLLHPCLQVEEILVAHPERELAQDPQGLSRARAKIHFALHQKKKLCRLE